MWPSAITAFTQWRRDLTAISPGNAIDPAPRILSIPVLRARLPRLMSGSFGAAGVTLQLTKLRWNRCRMKKMAMWRKWFGQVTPKGGIPVVLRFERASGLLRQSEVHLWSSRLIRHYSDWRDIGGGVMIPFFERDEYPEDESVGTIKIDS